MSSKFTQFIEQEKIAPRRLLSASRQVERLRREDRKTRLVRRQAKGGDTPAAEAAKTTAKPRSGRQVTDRLLREAAEGKAIPGPAKTRLLRAVNRVLEQRKKPTVDLRALF